MAKRLNINDTDFPTLIAHSPNKGTPTIKVVLTTRKIEYTYYAYLVVRGEVNNQYGYWGVCLGRLDSKLLRRFFNGTAKELNKLFPDDDEFIRNRKEKR